MRVRRRHPPSPIRLPVPVISVGNLAVGGTGKTPTVVSLVEMLRALGKRVGVVMRGYRAERAPRTEWVLVSDGERLRADVALAGDEALLFARACPDTPVAVGRSKAIAAKHLVETFPLDGIIVDDGFQHLKLARDLDIVLLDARRPFANGRVIPAGWLREPPDALRHAHLVGLTHANRVPDLERVREKVRTYAPNATIVASRHRARRLRIGGTDETLSLETLRGRDVLAVCGIASPTSFIEMLRELGASVRLKAFPDHHRYRAKDWSLLSRWTAATPVVTTAKDEVKWVGQAPFAYWVLDVAVEWTPEELVLSTVRDVFESFGS